MTETLECAIDQNKFRDRFSVPTAAHAVYERPEKYQDWRHRDDLGTFTCPVDIVPEQGRYEDAMLRTTFQFSEEPRDVERTVGETESTVEFTVELETDLGLEFVALRERGGDETVGELSMQYPYPDVDWFREPGDIGYLTVELEYDHRFMTEFLRFRADTLGRDSEITDETFTEYREDYRETLAEFRDRHF
ncbi:hypothetical protein ACOZ4N_05605 [Halorientalis pallida]|uniref:hypothetical protein n=1 Tax=Halorientalis pallida TaxID=2479928 RepID=UPI003C6F09F1